ncbi:MAG: DUF6089 family protein [Bacteroidales bacterium]
MKKNKIVCVLMLLFLCVPVLAQRSEIGAIAGASFYLGDLNPKKLFSQSKFSGGVFYRYNIDTRWAFRANLMYMGLSADDKKMKNPRNLNFKNNVYDFSAMIEVNFLNFFVGSKHEYRFTPYLTAGVAVFFHKPKAYYFNEHGKTLWQDLQVLHTEGQGMMEYPNAKPYSLVQFAIPFGVGFKYSISQRLCIGVEWTFRKTFTDYIDDVGGAYADPALLMAEYGGLSAYFSDPSENGNPVGSLRGNPSTKDWYSMAGFTLSIKLGTQDPPCSSYPRSAIDRVKKR